MVFVFIILILALQPGSAFSSAVQKLKTKLDDYLLNAQKVETIDGVRVVHNEKKGKWGEKPKVTPQLVRTIGSVDTDDENLAFYLPSDIAADSNGNIYILDSGNHRIQKFDPDGNYVATIGNKGKGPGEFYFPVSIDIDSKGYLYVSDSQNQRIQVLKSDGTGHKTVPAYKFSAGVVRITDLGNILVGGGGILNISPGRLEEKETQENLIKVVNLEGEVLKDFGQPFDFKDFLINRTGNQFHYAIDKEGNVYLAFDFKNRIEKYSADGKLLWRADRKLNYSTVPPKEKGSISGSGGMRMVRMPEMNICSNGIAVDEKGRAWVITLKRQMKKEEEVHTSVRATISDAERAISFSVSGNTENRETDIFELQVYDPDGTLLCKLPLNHFVDDIRIIKDRLFLLDKVRGMQYYEYKIIEK